MSICTVKRTIVIGSFQIRNLNLKMLFSILVNVLGNCASGDHKKYLFVPNDIWILLRNLQKKSDHQKYLYNTLEKKQISNSEWKNVLNVYNIFRLKNIWTYHHLHIKLDIVDWCLWKHLKNMSQLLRNWFLSLYQCTRIVVGFHVSNDWLKILK